DAVGQILPGAGDAFDPRLAAQLALGADLARHARDLRRERSQLIHHAVDDLGGAQELALEAPAFDLERHLLGQIARGHAAADATDLGGGLHEVRDQLVDRFHARRPASARAAQASPLRQLALLPDHFADALELLGHGLVALDDVVDGLGDFASDAAQPKRQPDR